MKLSSSSATIFAVAEETKRQSEAYEEEEEEEKVGFVKNFASYFNETLDAHESNVRRIEFMTRTREEMLWRLVNYYGVTRVRRAVEAMAVRPFINQTGAARGWATVDWMLQEEHFVALLEGKYSKVYTPSSSSSSSLSSSPLSPSEEEGMTKEERMARSRMSVENGERFDRARNCRTYGSGSASVPPEAPPRPDRRCFWDLCKQQWARL